MDNSRANKARFQVTSLKTTEKYNSTIKTDDTNYNGADFEEALSATGFGNFNLRLMLCMAPAFMSALSLTSAVSYTFTKAKCDLELTLVNMGTINAMSYAGMISSAVIWGFLSDTLGRKQILVWGYLAAGIVDMISGTSQSYSMLLVTRFIAGFIFNGPYAVVITYLAELHRADLRAKVILYCGCFYTAANTLLPLMAWLILPLEIEFEFFEETEIKSWNIYLMVIALLPISAGISLYFMPESPKFLMSRGRYDEALQVFQLIYARNTGNCPENYPIKCLRADNPEESARGLAALTGGFEQLRPLLQRPFLCYLFLLCYINYSCMLAYNTIRMWFPQLAAMLEAGSGAGFCSAVQQNHTVAEDFENCVELEASAITYIQNAAVGAAAIIPYVLAGLMIDVIGKRGIVAMSLGICAFSGGLLPFLGAGQVAEIFAVVFVAVIVSLASLAQTALSSVAVDLFTTSLRAMAMAIFFMSGRLGTISGNIAFPLLLQYGCVAPFVTIAVILAGGSLSCLLLPRKAQQDY